MSGTLDAIERPAGWLWVRFGAVVNRIQAEGRPDLPPLSVFLDEGVVPRSSRTDNFNALGADLGKYLVVRPGDIVFNKLRTWQGGLGVSKYTGIVSPAYYVCRPRDMVDSRYLHYLLRSSPYLQELTRISKWMPPSQFDTAWQDLRVLPVLIPSLGEQRAIAHYLDAETARIDALIAKKRRMIGLLQERRAVVFGHALEARGLEFPGTLVADRITTALPPGWRLVRLSQVLVQLTNGYVGPTRDILRDEGVRYVQSLHIKNGRIEFERRPFFVEEAWHRERPRIHLRPHDVLIVQTGDIGQVAVVPEGFGEASCHALQIARVRNDVLSGEYLGSFLRTPFGYESLLSRATGALHPHLEGGIRDVPIVVPPLPVQAEVLAEVDDQGRRAEALSESLSRQINLLAERRQALITSAVTGELDVPGAAT